MKKETITPIINEVRPEFEGKIEDFFFKEMPEYFFPGCNKSNIRSDNNGMFLNIKNDGKITTCIGVEKESEGYKVGLFYDENNKDKYPNVNKKHINNIEEIIPALAILFVDMKNNKIDSPLNPDH